MPETWQDLARDSRKAANELVHRGRYRSAVSRAYYAVYSKLAYEFSEMGIEMPEGREGPSHAKLRSIVENRLTRLSRKEREALSRIVGKSYVMRLYADYHPSDTMDSREAREAVGAMRTVFEAF